MLVGRHNLYFCNKRAEKRRAFPQSPGLADADLRGLPLTDRQINLPQVTAGTLTSWVAKLITQGAQTAGLEVARRRAPSGSPNSPPAALGAPGGFIDGLDPSHPTVQS